MIPIKVVVDTNVFISAFFHNDKNCQDLLRYNEKNKIKFYLNQDTYNELYFVFGELTEQVMKEINLAKTFQRFGKVMYNIEKINHKTKTDYCEDKSDNKFVDCCIDGNIQYLISKDIHVERIEEYKEEIKSKYGIELKILSPFQFSLEMLRLKFLK